jgi:hypothetical protein
MSYYAYLFEIRGIQRFLFSTGKLRDMVNASQLIDELCQEPLKAAIAALGLRQDQVLQPRRAGGCAYLILPNADTANRLQNLWRFTVQQLLPGIELVDVTVNDDTVSGVIEQGLIEELLKRSS